MRPPKYPPDWAEISEVIKAEAGYRCEIRGCNHESDPQTGYLLTTHHLDHNPENCSKENLVALCQRCHLRYQRWPFYLGKAKFLELTDRSGQFRLEI